MSTFVIIYSHTHTRTHIHTYTHMHTHTEAQTNTHKHTHTHTQNRKQLSILVLSQWFPFLSQEVPFGPIYVKSRQIYQLMQSFATPSTFRLLSHYNTLMMLHKNLPELRRIRCWNMTNPILMKAQ